MDILEQQMTTQHGNLVEPGKKINKKTKSEANKKTNQQKGAKRRAQNPKAQRPNIQ